MSYACEAHVITDDYDKTIPYGEALQCVRKLSDTTDWTLTVSSDNRELSPEQPDTEWTGVMNAGAYKADGVTYGKRLEVTVNDGSDHVMPHGIPYGYSYGLAGGNPHEDFQWRCKGIAAILYRNRISLPTIISTKTAATGAAAWDSGTTYATGDYATSGGHTYQSLQDSNTNKTPASNPSWWSTVSTGTLYYAQDVLASIFSAFGITADVSALSPNYLVPRMTMQNGSPIEFIRQILEVTQAEWYEDEGSIVVFQPDWATTDYDFSYTTEEAPMQAMTTDVSAFDDNFCNYLTCRRADDTGGVLCVAEAKDAAFGRSSEYSLSQPVPASSLRFDVKMEQVGRVSDIYIYGTSGPPADPIDFRMLKGSAPTVGVGSVAHGFSLTLGSGAGTPLGATAGSYRVEARGDNSFGIYADTTTALVVKNEASIASGMGTIKDTLGPNPLLADATTLQTWGERVLYKRSRKAIRRTVTIQTPNYDLRPGHRVRIQDAQFGNDLVLTVMSVTQVFVGDQRERKTVFEGVRYVDA